MLLKRRPKERIMITMDYDTLKRLDTLADTLGLSRSGLIELCVDSTLNEVLKTQAMQENEIVTSLIAALKNAS